jgi:hypothetical protein
MARFFLFMLSIAWIGGFFGTSFAEAGPAEITGVVNTGTQINIYYDHQPKPSRVLALSELQSSYKKDDEYRPIGFGNYKITRDEQFLIIEVLYDNCCTSYPVARALLVFKIGKSYHLIDVPQMLWAWEVVDQENIALEYGPTHGNCSGDQLVDLRNGRIIGSVFCDQEKQYSNIPFWAQILRHRN